MAIRLTESKLRQIIRQEINEMGRRASSRLPARPLPPGIEAGSIPTFDSRTNGSFTNYGGTYVDIGHITLPGGGDPPNNYQGFMREVPYILDKVTGYVYKNIGVHPTEGGWDRSGTMATAGFIFFAPVDETTGKVRMDQRPNMVWKQSWRWPEVLAKTEAFKDTHPKFGDPGAHTFLDDYHQSNMMGESRRRRQTISEMAGAPGDPAAMPAAVAPKWQAVVNKVISYYNPDDEGWMETIPERVMVTLSNKLGGIRAPNQMAMERAMVRAGIPRDEASALLDSAYSMSY